MIKRVMCLMVALIMCIGTTVIEISAEDIISDGYVVLEGNLFEAWSGSAITVVVVEENSNAISAWIWIQSIHLF